MSDRKKILITGGTGLVGNVLSNMLLKKGYEVAILSRNPGQKGQIRLYKWDIAQQYIDPEAFENTHAIIHLAGAGVADHRWTSTLSYMHSPSHSLSHGVSKGPSGKLEPY